MKKRYNHKLRNTLDACGVEKKDESEIKRLNDEIMEILKIMEPAKLIEKMEKLCKKEKNSRLVLIALNPYIVRVMPLEMEDLKKDPKYKEFLNMFRSEQLN